MKNVEIAEGGIGRRLSGTKFVLTDKPNSDQMETWVDEDDRKLARLYATSNGTYYPEDYDAYGFSSVTVSIHGGVANPNLPNIEMPDGTIVPALIPEIEMPDGTILPIDELFPDIPLDDVKIPDTVGEEGSSIVGIDPEDGYTYKVDVDENGNIDIEKVPTDIQIIGEPKEQTFGQPMDYSDLEIALVDKDGNIVKTKEYPTGTLTGKDANDGTSGLTLPVEDAPTKDEAKIKGTFRVRSPLVPNVSVACAGSFTVSWVVGISIYTGEPIVEKRQYSWGSMAMGNTNYGHIEGVVYQAGAVSGWGQYTLNGKTISYVQHFHGWKGFRGLKIEPSYDEPYPSKLECWVAAYGQGYSEEELPVYWENPYNGEVYEDGTTVITSSPYTEDQEVQS